MNLRIEVSPGDGECGVSIQGVDFPEAPADDEEFQVWDAKWTAICNGIHALLGELAPVPEEGWSVKFWVGSE